MTIEEMEERAHKYNTGKLYAGDIWLAAAEICKRLEALTPKAKEYSAGDIAEVRRKTGASMGECKRVLEFMNGNISLAIEVLKNRHG